MGEKVSQKFWTNMCLNLNSLKGYEISSTSTENYRFVWNENIVETKFDNKVQEMSIDTRLGVEISETLSFLGLLVKKETKKCYKL